MGFEERKYQVLLEGTSLLGEKCECFHKVKRSKQVLWRPENVTELSEGKVQCLKKDTGSLKEKSERPGADFCWFIFFFHLFIHYKSNFGAISKISCKISQRDYT